jgi:hypothetical protein
MGGGEAFPEKQVRQTTPFRKLICPCLLSLSLFSLLPC